MEISSNPFSQPQNESDPVESYRASATPLSRVRLYLIAQNVLLVPSLLVPLWSHPPELLVPQFVSFSLVAFSVWLLHKMYRQNGLFFRLESFRLLSVFLLSAYLFKSVAVFASSTLLLSLGIFISLIWLFILKPEFED